MTKGVTVGVLILSGSLMAMQQPTDRPVQPAPVDPCATGETPCNPDMPWMRGMVEKYCGSAANLAKLRKEHPEREIKACACKHKCDPFNKYAEATGGRAWDATCEARCRPGNCACDHVCDT